LKQANGNVENVKNCLITKLLTNFMQEIKREDKINEYVLRLGGKVTLLEPVDLGHNYSIKVGGSITEKTDKDNEDGTINRYFKFEPVQVEIISPLGKTIKSKDPRSKSKLLRACIYKHWKEFPNDMSDEDFYDTVLNYIISNSEKIAEKALKEFN